jgi:hypothetical protein
MSHMLLRLHLAATLFMTGVIWFVQVVHYPLLARVPPEAIPAYQAANVWTTASLVAVPMWIEGVTAVLLLWRRPPGLPVNPLRLGLALLAVIWLSTWQLELPRHEALRTAFDPATLRSLIDTNWVRTAAWTARSALALTLLCPLPPSVPSLTR